MRQGHEFDLKMADLESPLGLCMEACRETEENEGRAEGAFAPENALGATESRKCATPVC